MEQIEAKQQLTSQDDYENDVHAITPVSESQEDTMTSSQAGHIASGGEASGGQSGSGNAKPSISNGTDSLTKSYIYVLGRVEARFPTIAIEKVLCPCGCDRGVSVSGHKDVTVF